MTEENIAKSASDIELPGALVDSGWLAAHLGQPHLRIYDASVYLPGEGISARQRFLAAHIPGARFFDIDTLSDQSSPLPHMAPAPREFERLARDLDLSDDSRVVFYDQRGLYSAARGWWLLRLFGHERVAVLDGGLPGWQREQRPIAAGEPSPASAAGAFRARLRPELVRGIDAMRANLQTSAERVLDARPAGRFTAALPEPRPGLRGGHMPGARSLPLSQLLTADSKLLAPVELERLFASLGVTAQTPVVASCGSGVTAAGILLALAVAGFRDGALYDGSWAEWGGRSDTPIETG